LVGDLTEAKQRAALRATTAGLTTYSAGARQSVTHRRRRPREAAVECCSPGRP